MTEQPNLTQNSATAVDPNNNLALIVSQQVRTKTGYFITKKLLIISISLVSVPVLLCAILLGYYLRGNSIEHDETNNFTQNSLFCKNITSKYTKLFLFGDFFLINSELYFSYKDWNEQCLISSDQQQNSPQIQQNGNWYNFVFFQFNKKKTILFLIN